MTGTPADAIYANFHDGVGTGPLERTAETLAQAAEHYGEVARDIMEITRAMEQAWSGAASGAAMRGAGPLVFHHQIAESLLTKAQNVTVDQVVLFNEVKSLVQPIPLIAAQPGWWDDMITVGGASANYEASLRQYQAVTEHNVNAMRLYEEQATNNASALPTSFGSMVVDPTAIVIDPPPAGTETPTRVQPPVPVRSRVTGTHEPVVARAPARSGTEQQRVGTGEVQVHYQQQTDPSQVAPRPPVVAPQPGPTPQPGPNPGQLPGYPPPGVRPPVVALPPVRMPGGGSTTGSVGATGGRTGQFGGGGSQPGQQGGGSGQRVPTAAEQGRGLSARGLGAEAGRGFGPEGARTGVGPTEGVRGSGVSEGTRGAGQGRAGGGLPMGGGGAAGQGEDDLERSAPAYLVVPDPEDLFGTDAITAPPVIGE